MAAFPVSGRQDLRQSAFVFRVFFRFRFIDMLLCVLYNTAKAMIKASNRIMAVYREPRVTLRAGRLSAGEIPLVCFPLKPPGV